MLVLKVLCSKHADGVHDSFVLIFNTISMRVLIIEDSEKLAKSLKKGLEQEGYSADYLTVKMASGGLNISIKITMSLF